MLQISLIVGWVIAVVFLVFLVVQAVKHRLIRRGGEDFADERRQGENPDGVVPAPAHEAVLDYRRGIAIIGYISLFLWEAFWISEITDRFKWSANPFQLPYFFLLIVLVGVPLAVYLFSRRMLRDSAQSS